MSYSREQLLRNASLLKNTMICTRPITGNGPSVYQPICLAHNQQNAVRITPQDRFKKAADNMMVLQSGYVKSMMAMLCMRRLKISGEMMHVIIKKMHSL